MRHREQSQRKNTIYAKKELVQSPNTYTQRQKNIQGLAKVFKEHLGTHGLSKYLLRGDFVPVHVHLTNPIPSGTDRQTQNLLADRKFLHDVVQPEHRLAMYQLD